MKDVLRYEEMVERALRGVVRETLTHVAMHGLPGSHHFYITFRTMWPGVEIPDYLNAKYPDQMTIVLEHQFWDLKVTQEAFSVTLTFANKPERLVIPLEAITVFADPSVKFLLPFQPTPEPDGDTPGHKPGIGQSQTSSDGDGKSGEVVTLDSFRKK